MVVSLKRQSDYFSHCFRVSREPDPLASSKCIFHVLLLKVYATYFRTVYCSWQKASNWLCDTRFSLESGQVEMA